MSLETYTNSNLRLAFSQPKLFVAKENYAYGKWLAIRLRAHSMCNSRVNGSCVVFLRKGYGCQTY